MSEINSHDSDQLRERYSETVQAWLVMPLLTQAMLEGLPPHDIAAHLSRKKQQLRGRGEYVLMKGAADGLPAAERAALMDLQFDLTISDLQDSQQ